MRAIRYIFVLLLAISFSYAQFAKVGQAGAKFLSIGYSPRAIGMGEAFVAVANDASSVFWNPAGIANTKGKSLYLSHTEWWVDTHVPGVAYVTPIGAFGKLTVFLGGIYSPNFEEAKLLESGEIEFTGKTFAYDALEAGVGYARYFTDKFAAGVNIKGVYEGFGGYSSAKAVAMDVGTYFKTGFKSLRIAMTLQNLGSQMKPSGDYNLFILKGLDLIKEKRTFNAYPLPMVFRIGAAMEVVEGENTRVTLSTEALYPNDNVESLAFGTEISLRNLLFIRGGYRLGKDEGGASFGFGLNAGSIRLDYAFSDNGHLPDVHRIGLLFGF